MIVTHHISINIDYILGMTDKKLRRYFDMPAHEVRRELIQRKAAGHRLIGSDNCEGFDPVNGCPGHPKSKNTSPNE